jgi:hypothetical protein
MSRAMVCKVIAECLDAANLWTKHAHVDQSRIVSTGNHYADYREKSSACAMATLSGVPIPDTIEIGHAAYCISCGDTQNESNILDCCDTTSDMVECEGCYARIHEDDAIWVGDSCYCSDCVSYCEHCQENYHESEVQWVDSVRKRICDDCLAEEFTKCTDCKQFINKDDAYCVNGNRYCKDCYHERFSDCDECGETFENGELTKTEDGRWVCRACYTELAEQESCQLVTA